MTARRRARLRIALALLAGLVLPLGPWTACGGDEDDATVDLGDVKIEREGDSVRIESEEGVFEGRFGQGASLPDGFPDDVPIPEGAQIVASMNVPAQGAMVSMRVPGGVEEVSSALARALEEAGWSIDQEMNVAGQRVVVAEKEDRRVQAQTADQEGDTTVILNVGRRP